MKVTETAVMTKKQKARDKWTYINIPKEMAHEIDDIIKSREGGFYNRADFVREAIRLKFQNLKETHNNL